jgi:hypothetical protein
MQPERFTEEKTHMKVGAITLMTALLLALPAFAGPPDPCAGFPDTDSDGFTDPCDNCLNIANPSQTDCDSDGCGNICDADFDQNGVVAAGDLNSLLGAFGSGSCKHDIGAPDPPEPNGVVAAGDLARLLALFGTAPGPSGTTSGTTACP